MQTSRLKLSRNRKSMGAHAVLPIAALAAMFLVLPPAARAQGVDYEPGTLAKQRAALCLKAGHTPLADLEGEVNHLAVLSESCRIESGAKACGLAEKSLASDKLEDRYAYYVRQPVEAHSGGQQVKIERRNWASSSAPNSSRQSSADSQ